MKTGAQASPSPACASMATAPFGASENTTADTAPMASSKDVGLPTPYRSNAIPTGICATANARKKEEDKVPKPAADKPKSCWSSGAITARQLR